MSRALLFLGKSQEAKAIKVHLQLHVRFDPLNLVYESIATVGEIRVYWRDDFQSGSRVLKKVF